MKPLIVCQLSDLHLFAHKNATMFGINTHDSLQAVLTELTISGLQPDLILLTGDLAQEVSTQTYKNVVAHFKPWNCPIHWIPGNHDEPEMMSTVFANTHFSSEKAFHLGAWKFILLSSFRDGNNGEGYVEEAELQFLAHEMKGNDPTMIVIHHNILPVGVSWIDENVGLHNGDELLKMLTPARNVKCVINGHVHQAQECEQAGMHFLACPSTCFQFHSSSENFSLEDLPPGFRVLRLYPDGTFVTEIIRVRNYQGKLDINAPGYH